MVWSAGHILRTTGLALYSKGTLFKFGPRGRISWENFVNPSRQMPRQYLKLNHDHYTPHISNWRFTPITLQFDTTPTFGDTNSVVQQITHKYKSKGYNHCWLYQYYAGHCHSLLRIFEVTACRCSGGYLLHLHFISQSDLEFSSTRRHYYKKEKVVKYVRSKKTYRLKMGNIANYRHVTYTE
jgi:hypothetical protein